MRVLRALPITRRKLTPVVLRTILKTFFTADADKETKEFLLKFVPEGPELDSSLTPSRGKASATPLYPEVDFYISLLVLISLIDTKKGLYNNLKHKIRQFIFILSIYFHIINFSYKGRVNL